MILFTLFMLGLQNLSLSLSTLFLNLVVDKLKMKRSLSVVGVYLVEYFDN